ncbi:penicillin-binding protein 1A [Rhabdaerophilum sp.]|uniref:penicillin-binding protein 1A n=1 Tax=Rhabdaerophilum sp. TaxID=2717341 RepID=UPI0022C6B353|nr:penicillin-binding protein 1A [Beijerinckiaceae bacterium]
MRLIARFLAFLFGTLTLVGLVGAAAVSYVVWHYSQDLPDHAQLANYEPPVTTRVHAADGSLLAEYARERRLYLPIQAMPQLLIAAFLSAEDKNFYKHGGVDPEGLARAVVTQFRRGSGGRQQGGSTITQQVAKNFFLTRDQTVERKIREALLAFRLEATFSKDKILELYMNQIFLGSGNYGVAAAALNYFGKSVHELSISEAAYLAALPKAPSNYHPINHREAALGRRNYVIDRMLENGYISREDAQVARAEPLVATFRQLSPNAYAAGFFAEEVRREIVDRYGNKKLLEGGLSVRSTLDPRMQVLARKALSDGLVRYDEARGWRGAQDRIPPTGDWGIPLAEVQGLTDVDPWRLAVILDVTNTEARIGLQPTRLSGGQVDRKRETGIIPPEGVRWTNRPLARVVNPGDVVYVEPIAGQEGRYRLRQVPEISGALVAMDPHTGRVKAMVGGFSFDKSEFNRATQALRQVGSSFKPFVYATALDNGYTPSSIILDEPIELDQGNGEIWRPENYDGKPTGPRTLRYGVEQSKNLMTVRLARDLGMPLVAEYAKRFGVYDDMLPVLAMSLGAGETTVLRMTAAYSMMANGGKRIRPTLIDRIQDRWGATIYRHDERQCDPCSSEAWNEQDEPRLIDRRERVIDPMTAYQITSIMEGVTQRGTAAQLRALGRTFAGKTGTTNDAKDVWFVGFSPDLAVGVYLGFDKPQSLGSRATAGTYAVPIFSAFMKEALAGKPNLQFRVPPGIKFIRVNARTGQRTTAGDPQAILEPFKPNTAPPENYSFGEVTAGGVVVPGGPIGSTTGGLY